MRRLLPLFLCLPLLGAGCFGQTPTAQTNKPVTNNSEQTTNSKQKEPLSFSSTTLSEASDLYTIRVDHPVVSGGPGELRSNISSAVAAYVATTTANFKDYLKDADKWYSGAKYDLAMDYSVPLNDDHFVSLFFDGYEFTGGAHGAHIYETMVFDVASGKRLALSDIFSTSTYLQVLAREYRAKLGATSSVTDMSDTDWLKQGTEPTADNYKYWYLAHDGLHVIFPPYQVAAYAAGEFDIVVPYADLQDILQPWMLSVTSYYTTS